MTPKAKKITQRARALIQAHALSELEWLLDEEAAAERLAARGNCDSEASSHQDRRIARIRELLIVFPTTETDNHASR